jgi:hypothetical protein
MRVQQFRGVAAEDLPDLGGPEPAVSKQPGQVGELVVAGQDGPVVAVQVGADSQVARPRTPDIEPGPQEPMSS